MAQCEKYGKLKKQLVQTKPGSVVTNTVGDLLAEHRAACPIFNRYLKNQKARASE